MSNPKLSLQELAAAIEHLTPEERRQLIALLPNLGQEAVKTTSDAQRLLTIIGLGESGQTDGSTQHDRDLYGG